MENRKIPAAGEFYRHFKGKSYQIIGIARHSETGEKLVIYQALYGDYSLYARPLDMFLSPVDRAKYPEAAQEFRFEKIVPGEDSAREEKSENDATEEKLSGAAEIEIKKVSQQESFAERSENAETVREDILRFLDAESAEDKLTVLRELRKKMDENLLTTIELSLDLLPDERESMERRYELVEQTLSQRVRFEGTRLR